MIVIGKYGKKILDIVNDSSEHLTAEQIFLLLKTEYQKVVLATVYNNLNKLEEEKLIRKINMSNQADRYDKVKRHDHLVCSKCGKITDVHFTDITGAIEENLKKKIDSYDLKLFYVCDDCKDK